MKLKIPHPYTLIFFLIIFIAILTYIVPAGEFDRYIPLNTHYLNVSDGSMEDNL